MNSSSTGPTAVARGLSCCLCMGTRVRPARARACSSDLTGAPLWQPLMKGRLERMRERDYLAAAVSLPGYRTTSGPPDFWGPRSQAALRAALDYLWSLPGTDRTKVVVYGVSGGAATASMVARRMRASQR